jgi:hypothetical protein
MTDQIEARIGTWLDSRKPPSGLTDEQRAGQRADIIGIVRRAAPADGDLGEWLGRVLEGAILRQKSASWPPPEVWGNVVGSMGGRPQPAPDQPTSRGEVSFRLFVQRINAGEAISEHDLFSERVCGRALRDRLVSLDVVLGYVRAIYAQRCHVYSPEKAMAWLEGRNPKLAAKIAAEQQAQADLRDVTGGG